MFKRELGEVFKAKCLRVRARDFCVRAAKHGTSSAAEAERGERASAMARQATAALPSPPDGGGQPHA